MQYHPVVETRKKTLSMSEMNLCAVPNIAPHLSSTNKQFSLPDMAENIYTSHFVTCNVQIKWTSVDHRFILKSESSIDKTKKEMHLKTIIPKYLNLWYHLLLAISIISSNQRLWNLPTPRLWLLCCCYLGEQFVQPNSILI